MDNEMIERVAKGIGELAAHDSGCNSDRCGCYGAEALECKSGLTLEQIAIAAIKAMREPTKKMVAAIHGCYPDIPDKHAYPVAKAKWQAAIDAVIND